MRPMFSSFGHGEVRSAEAIIPNLRPDAEIVHPPFVKLFNLPESVALLA